MRACSLFVRALILADDKLPSYIREETQSLFRLS